MFTTLLRLTERFSDPGVAYAHCDIPCGIYDPHAAQIAAHTIVRMNQLIADLPTDNMETYGAKLGRYVATKEEHAEIVKREIRVLWGDYFRPEHAEAYPNLHTLVFTTMKQASAARQNVSKEAAQTLLASVQEIAEIFWKTKGATPQRLPSRQTSGGEIVYPG
ncbi:MAG: superoxide dismutase, Ni [Chloroflexi bacterium]|nr:superoxide dismutase, Ni [Chloroflexota bacterium]